MLNWTQNRLNAALANGDGINLRVSYDMDATFEGKAGEFDRHLTLVLNKLEG